MLPVKFLVTTYCRKVIHPEDFPLLGVRLTLIESLDLGC